MRILALESSCDETAVAVLDAPRTVRASVLHSQVAIHRPFGGIVPELASRSHIERVLPLIDEALAAAGADLSTVDAVAATRGPGLVGALLVGLAAGQGLAMGRNLPFVGVNHLYGHLLSPDLADPMAFPALVLLVTGGHSALYRMAGEQEVVLLRRTVDDAVGEAFDKVAKLLGLSYPGGPSIERAARAGDPDALALPRPRPKDPNALSFSGLKTAVRRSVLDQGPTLGDRFVADLCASFQAAVADVLVDTVSTAIAGEPSAPAAVYLVGGVARNATIRQRLEAAVAEAGCRLVCAPPEYCTDNAAMIARAAWPRLRAGEFDPWDIQPYSRWEVGPWAA